MAASPRTQIEDQSAPQYGRVEAVELNGVHPWWRASTIVLVVLFVVVAVLATVATHQISRTQTAVQWHEYTIPGTPRALNEAVTYGSPFCVPSDAVTVGLVSMDWWTYPSHNATSVVLFVSGGYTHVTLYESTNSSYGGVTFNSTADVCQYPWYIVFNSTTADLFTALITLTYNYTAESSGPYL